MNIHQIACVESEYIFPGVIYIDGKLRHPFRLYTNEEGNVCVLVCEAPIMISGIHSVLNTVMDWAIKKCYSGGSCIRWHFCSRNSPNLTQSIILGSTEMDESVQNITKKDDKTISISNNQRNIPSNFIKNVIDDSNKQHTTFIGGIAGGLLSACLSYQIPCAAILIPSSSGIPDPEGAAILIESYNSIIKNEYLKINPDQLKEQGQILKKQLEQIIKSEQEQRDRGYMTNQGLMYG